MSLFFLRVIDAAGLSLLSVGPPFYNALRSFSLDVKCFIVFLAVVFFCFGKFTPLSNSPV